MHGVGRKIIEIPIKDIKGIHHDLIAEERMLGVAPEPFALFQPGLLPRQAIEALLELRPVLVRRDKSKYTCVGNVRELMLAATLLPPDHSIPVRLVKGGDAASRLFWTDRLVTPVIRNTGDRWSQWLYQAWRRFKGAGSPPVAPGSLLNASSTQRKFAQALGLDPRQMQADEPPEAG